MHVSALLVLLAVPTLLGRHPCPEVAGGDVVTRDAPAWSGVDGRMPHGQIDQDLRVTLRDGIATCVFNPGPGWRWSLDADRAIPPGWSVSLEEVMT